MEVTKEILFGMYENGGMEMGIDTKGRLVTRATNSSFPSMYKDHSVVPFKGCSFICIDREDAENILEMLNSAIVRLESGTRQDNDMEVFGLKAISYERLIDALGHTIWKKEDAEG